jgi:hypothetical protein
MIVERWTWKAKPGRRDQLIELVKHWVEHFGLTPRVCSHDWGNWDTVSSDLEFETDEGRQKFWAGVGGSEHTETLKKMEDLIESGTTHELLRVH